MLSRFDFTRAGIVAVAAGFPVFAIAQVKDVAPYQAVIVVPSADVHSGETSVFYRVGALQDGAIVLVDGESANWSRISYPADSFAIVRAEDATYDPATKELKLSKPSRLFAGNKTSGFAGSWKALLPTTLPVGTTLKVLQVEEGAAGSGAVAYRVPVPAEGRAFTESKNLRKATPAEVNAFRAKGGTVPAVGATSPAPSTEPVAAAPATNTPASSPNTSAPTTTPSTPVVDNSLVTPMNTSGTAGAPAPATSPAASTPASSEPTATTPAPVTIDQSTTNAGSTPAQGTATPSAASAPAPAPPVTANMRAAARIKELDQAFDRVNAQPLGEAEYETLISEYERTLQSLSGQITPRQRTLLEQRLNILKFRKDLRQQQLALLNESGTVQQQNQQVLQNVAQVESTRVYSIVGQLQPSTVYNGQTLPLMYRIQSVGTSVPRTLGYIKPDPRFSFNDKLGQIVGVIGDSSMDKDLKLNVITPVRIDLLQGVPMQPSQPAQPMQQPPVQVPSPPSGQLPPVVIPDSPPQQRVVEPTK